MNEIEQFFYDHFGKDAAEVKADVEKALGYVTEHAPAVEKLAGTVVDALKVMAPGLGDAAQGVLTEAEAALAELEALGKKYFGGQPSGM